MTRRFPRPAAGERWRLAAACRHVEPERMFPDTVERLFDALEVCATCPVREPCAAYALGTGQLWGVWGGLSQEDLRAAARHRPRPAPPVAGMLPPRPDPRGPVLLARARAAADAAYLHNLHT